jgi:hypothetical protein
MAVFDRYGSFLPLFFSAPEDQDRGMNLLLILLAIVLTTLLVRYLLRIIRTDAPADQPASHADWNADSLPSSAYALRHDA